MDKEFLFKQEYIDLFSELNLKSLLGKLANRICHFLECQESAMFLYNSVKEELSFQTATGEKQDQLKKIVLKKGQGLVGWVAEHMESVIVNDCKKDPRVTTVTDRKTNFTTRSLLAVPVHRERKFLGVLEVVNKRKGDFTEEDKYLLERIAALVSIPLQNAMLFEEVLLKSNEKQQLIELAKIISSSTDLEEIFTSLKNIILQFSTPHEVNVMVKSRDETFQLVSRSRKPYEDFDVNETSIDDTRSIFPLRSQTSRLGYLEIKGEKKLPAEVVSLFKGLAVFTAISIERFEMMERIIEKEKLEMELDIARTIQQGFLPDEKIEIDGVDTAYINIPSSAVGGDYFDIVNLKDSKTIFTINDVSGHGVGAALVMSIFSANFTYRIKKDNDTLKTICHLNDLIAETTETNNYVTSFTGHLDRKSLEFNYINAGHNPPFLFRRGEVLELSESDMVLGMFQGVSRSSTSLELQPGDVILMYTDGLIEAENPEEEMFSSTRVKNLVQEAIDEAVPSLPEAKTIKNTLIHQLKQFVKKDQFTDDITFLIIIINKPNR